MPRNLRYDPSVLVVGGLSFLRDLDGLSGSITAASPLVGLGDSALAFTAGQAVKVTGADPSNNQTYMITSITGGNTLHVTPAPGLTEGPIDTATLSEDPMDSTTWSVINPAAFAALCASSGYAYFQAVELNFDCVVGSLATTDYEGNSVTVPDALIKWKYAGYPLDVEVSFDNGEQWLDVVTGGVRLPNDENGFVVYTIPGLSALQPLAGSILSVRTLWTPSTQIPAGSSDTILDAVRVTVNCYTDPTHPTIVATIDRLEDSKANLSLGTLRGCAATDRDIFDGDPGAVERASDNVLYFEDGWASIDNPNSSVRNVSTGPVLHTEMPNPADPSNPTKITYNGWDDTLKDVSAMLASFSVEMRVRADATDANWGGPLLTFLNSSGNIGWSLQIGEAAVTADTAPLIAMGTWFSGGFPGSMPVAAVVSDPVIHRGRDHHVAATFDGYTMRLYVDGIQMAQQAVTRDAYVFAPGGGPWGTGGGWTRIGSGPPGVCFDTSGAATLANAVNWNGMGSTPPITGGSFSLGYIGEVRLWSRCLSPGEVLARMNRPLTDAEVKLLKASGPKGAPGSTPGLIAYYRMNDGALCAGDSTDYQVDRMRDTVGLLAGVSRANDVNVGVIHKASPTDKTGYNGAFQWSGYYNADYQNPDGTTGATLSYRQSPPLRLDTADANAVYITNAPFTFSMIGADGNPHSFLGVGSLGTVDAIAETARLETAGISMTLSGVNPAFLAIATNTPYVERPCRVYGVFFDSTGQIAGLPILLFAGRMQTMPFTLGATAKITISAESRLVDWERPRKRVWTDVDQRARFNGDAAFSQIAGIADKEVWWPALFATTPTS